MSTTHSRPRTSARSKLYERYDVEIQTTQEPSSRKWLNEDEPPKEIPLEDRTNLELIFMIFKTLSWRTKLIATLVIVMALSVSIRIIKRSKVQPQPTIIEEKRWMPADSHARCNPFAEDTACAMEGVLEIKRIGSGGRQKDDEEQWVQELLKQEHVQNDLDRHQHIENEQQTIPMSEIHSDNNMQPQHNQQQQQQGDTSINNDEQQQLQQQQTGEDLIMYDDVV
jgi:hypothetical protein